MTVHVSSEVVRFQAFLVKARLLDLGPIAYQLMHRHAGDCWTKAQAVQAISQYLAFLYLVDHYPRLSLVPTPAIDRVWHQHILDTEKYAEDCQQLFGYFIHHFPYLGTRGEGDRQQWYRAYALTQVLFRKHFGNEFSRDFANAPIPADCEPLRLLNGCRTRLQDRPTVAISEVEDGLRTASNERIKPLETRFEH